MSQSLSDIFCVKRFSDVIVLVVDYSIHIVYYCVISVGEEKVGKPRVMRANYDRWLSVRLFVYKLGH